MIRNIVFDMGMVLLEYDPVKVCWEYTDNPEDVEWMHRELFDSKEWSLLDEGTLTDAQALERVQKRLPNEHLRWLAKESLEHWHEYNICTCGKRFAEKNKFLPRYHRMTNRLSAYIIDKLRDVVTYTSVAREMNLTPLQKV